MPLALVIALVAIAALALLVAVAYALGWFPGERLQPLRASAVEARERSSDLAAEFFEWLRTGR